jgi:hypothetical protein
MTVSLNTCFKKIFFNIQNLEVNEYLLRERERERERERWSGLLLNLKRARNARQYNHLFLNKQDCLQSNNVDVWRFLYCACCIIAPAPGNSFPGI